MAVPKKPSDRNYAQKRTELQLMLDIVRGLTQVEPTPISPESVVFKDRGEHTNPEAHFVLPHLVLGVRRKPHYFTFTTLSKRKQGNEFKNFGHMQIKVKNFERSPEPEVTDLAQWLMYVQKLAFTFEKTVTGAIV